MLINKGDLFMKSITPELAEILGLLCAEGSYILSFPSYWGKDKGKRRFYKNHKSERIEFSNKDRKLLNHFQSLIQTQYGYKPNATKHNKINICRRSVIREIISYTELGCLTWSIPKEIMSADINIKISFLRGFFDGDGTASSIIRFFSINKNGLIQVNSLLNELNLKSTFLGPYEKIGRKPYYVIQISRTEKENFLNIIKPISKRPDLRG